MKKVFKDIDHIAKLFVKQEQPEAMTPLTYIQNKDRKSTRLNSSH